MILCWLVYITEIENGMGEACRKYGGEGKCIQGCGGET